MKKLIAYSVAVLLWGCSCSKPKAQGNLPPTKETEHEVIAAPSAQDTLPWTTYTIKHNTHDPANGFLLNFFSGDTLQFRVAFDETVRAKTRDPKNQKDWNKVFGFSDCGGHHHANSLRLVWRYDTASNLVELGRYAYVESNRKYTKLTEVAVGDTVLAMLYRNTNTYGIKVNGVVDTLARACDTKLLSYYLFPYYGGDETAPQDINIHVQHLSPTL